MTLISFSRLHWHFETQILIGKSLCAHYLLNQWLEFYQTSTDTSLGQGKEEIRFWWPWHHFQGNYIIKWALCAMSGGYLISIAYNLFSFAISYARLILKFAVIYCLLSCQASNWGSTLFECFHGSCDMIKSRLHIVVWSLIFAALWGSCWTLGRKKDREKTLTRNELQLPSLYLFCVTTFQDWRLHTIVRLMHFFINL